jgi:hypothetical protein
MMDYLTWLEEELAAGQPMKTMVGTFTTPQLVLVGTFAPHHVTPSHGRHLHHASLSPKIQVTSHAHPHADLTTMGSHI